MDFYDIQVREIEKGPNKGMFEVFPNFRVMRSKDLMIRGKAFYAIWDAETSLWSTDEYDVQRLVDKSLYEFAEKYEGTSDRQCVVKSMQSFGSNSWVQFRRYIQQLSDNSHELDQSLTFANDEVKKSDYVSRRLPYSLMEGDYSAWDELVGTLYSTDNRAKIEWVIGAIISGDSKRIQKFLVLYGPGGTGKSTMLDIVERLFVGYTTSFEAKALGGNNNQFATEAFKHNPLVALQHDGDLSKIEDNTKLNSIVSHEEMTMNEKYKPSYTARVNAFLLMGTNQPVKITDAKSGIIRRLIDAQPTGARIPVNHYHTLMSKIDFELGAIAAHCLDVYHTLGKNYYSSYRPTEMMLQTDVFFNFIEAHYDIFKAQDGTSLRQAYNLYKEFCAETGVDKVLPQYKFREELRNYFDDFHDRKEVDGEVLRSYYSSFSANKFKAPKADAKAWSLVLDETSSLLDEELSGMAAQLATASGVPQKPWATVQATLADVDTSLLHFVKVPANQIVIDFDLTGDDGGKDLERNLEAASGWPSTYAELSKSGSGVHLHYTTDLEPGSLATAYSAGIEVKTFSGDASLRRKLTHCNNVPIATLNSGLPLKEKTMLTDHSIKSEKHLRDMIAKNFKKEFHPGTKPSVDFIAKLLSEAYDSGMEFDVSDLKPKMVAFAHNSSNQPVQSLRVVRDMKWKSDTGVLERVENPEAADERLVFFDVEVYKNLLIVCWKYEGDANVVKLINPDAPTIEALVTYKLVGFNNRRYDNHILYARILGYTNEDLYRLSQRLISNDRQGTFPSAYDLSYADIFDFSSVKQTLKKFQVELGLFHSEMDLSWDEPAPEDQWDRIVEYCANDVVTTEQVFLNRKGDYDARRILAALSGLPVNEGTSRHVAKILFGSDRRPSDSFKYTDLRKDFPGYEFERGKSTYRGYEVGEGGFVYAEPGVYDNVVVLDIASMHPTSIEQLNLFGKYTPNFAAIREARIAIKRGDYDAARNAFDGKLAPYLEKEEDAADLSYALKIVINTVYGLTAAKFDTPFRDKRNIDNIVAKRGALFMVDLKEFVEHELGQKVVHIKTDSIKLSNATDEEINQVFQFGEKYGYEFENEGVYERFALVNDAVYIARKNGNYEATGAQFAHPYVFKSLFTKEEIEFTDLVETKQVMGATMYLDYQHDVPLESENPDVGRMAHIGGIGQFVPVEEGEGGGVLYRYKDGKLHAVTGTKNKLWLPAEVAKDKEDLKVDVSYYEALADKAIETINKFGPYDEFIN